LRSVINSDLVSSIDLVPGAFGAEHGRGLGGLVSVETRALDKHGVHGYVGADTLDGSLLTTAALSERIRVGVGGRVSWLDSVLSTVNDRDLGDTFPIPRYRDYQAKATFDLRKNEAIDLVFLGSRDALDRQVPSPDPAKTRSDASEQGFHRLYVKYTKRTEDQDLVTVTPFVGRDTSSQATSSEGRRTTLDVDAWKYGLTASYRSRVVDHATATLGIDALGSAATLSRTGSLTLPPREGDVAVFGQIPSDDAASDAWSTHELDLGPYAACDLDVGKLTVTPGLRFDMFLLETSRLTPRVGATPPIGYSDLHVSPDPRLALRYRATSRLSFSASAGLYHQAPDPEDRSAVFGTPDLSVSKATQVSAGESLRITQTLSLETTGFYKSLGDLVVRSLSTTPRLARVLVQNGEGRSYGVQFLLRQDLWKGFFGWVSYAISRSERRYEGMEYRRFDFDQPHVLSVVASQEISRWTFGARFRYASGNPRTPVVGAYYDARIDAYEPLFGAQNSDRLPAFVQLDAKVERQLAVTSWANVRVFLDVQNVTFYPNKEEVAYSSDYARRDYIRGLPTLAIVGGRFEY
jgi:hypothetical protein